MIHRPLALFTLLVLVVCALVGSASAGVVVSAVNLTPAQQQGHVTDIAAGWQTPSVPLTFPSFDTNLGTLTQVRLLTSYHPTYRARAENTSFSPIPGQSQWYVGWQTNHAVMFSYKQGQANPFNLDYEVGGAVLSHFFPHWIQPSTADLLSAWDGVTDWAGTSGFDTGVTDSGYTVAVAVAATSYRELQWWASGTTRTVYLEPRMLSEAWPVFDGHHWTGGQDLDLHFASQVYVEYTYQ